MELGSVSVSKTSFEDQTLLHLVDLAPFDESDPEKTSIQ